MAHELRIPWYYRLTFNYIEPSLAVLGALANFVFPEENINSQTPFAGRHYSHAATALAPLAVQISGGWLLLAFHDLVTLRYTRDVNIWRLVLAGGLISDVIYTYSLWMDPANNRWTIFASGTSIFLHVTTVCPMLLKVAFLLGVGLDTGSKKKSP